MGNVRRMLLLGLIPVVGCFGGNNGGLAPTAYEIIGIKVSGAGTGAGRVTSTPASIGIGCRIVSGRAIATPMACQLGFSDAGGGGSLQLTAVPDSNSVFDGWTGCTSVAGRDCTLRYQSGRGGTDFDVVASFRVR